MTLSHGKNVRKNRICIYIFLTDTPKIQVCMNRACKSFQSVIM